jgi:putative ABC transport system substrate-binding protein
MRRRDVLVLGGVAAAWPFVAGAQQAMPTVGFLSSSRAAAQTNNVAAFRASLKEAGFVEGQNVAVDFRWADDHFDRLPGLAADLIRRPVTLIMANGLAAFQAKAATKIIPIVFTTGTDPVRDGLVASLNRPGGNVTGVVFITGLLGSKRLAFLHQLVPKVTTIGAIINPNTKETELERHDLQAASQKLGQRLVIVDVTDVHDLEPAFATMKGKHAGALIVGAGAFLFSNRGRIVELAARHALPAVYPVRDAVAEGGLMSYGTSSADAYRQAARYVARVLKGEKPSELPVIQSSKFEFVINRRTAKALDLEVPPQLLATADEVIE